MRYPSCRHSLQRESWQGEAFRSLSLQAFLRRHAASEAQAIAPFLTGCRLLDLGVGEGYVAAALRQQTGIWTCAVDVGAYQRTPWPFLIYDGTYLTVPGAGARLAPYSMRREQSGAFRPHG
jgi:hypothetical protein